jgi:hypothetical protein
MRKMFEIDGIRFVFQDLQGNPLPIPTQNRLRRRMERRGGGETFHDNDTGILYDVARAKRLVKGRAPDTAIPTTHPGDTDLLPDAIAGADPRVPGIVCRIDEGHYLILDGNHRFMRAKQLGWPHFYVHSLSFDEMLACQICLVEVHLSQQLAALADRVGGRVVVED